MGNLFAGTWTYRSFLNNPAPVGGDLAKLEALLFAEAVWTVEDSVETVFKGELRFGPNDIMDLNGIITPSQSGRPAHVHIVGAVRPGTPTEHMFYDYDGSLAERWPNGVHQISAITGSVIRIKPHDGEAAGLVASFIAVKSS